MGTINRNQLKYNFLRETIIRLDIVGVFQQEIDGIIVNLKSYLKEKGFNRYSLKNQNSISFELNGNGIGIDSPNDPALLADSMKIHNFTNEDTGISLDISHQFIILNIKPTKYIAFEEYYAYINKVYQVLEEKIPFLTLKRLGIRKINQCGLENEEDFHKYFVLMANEPSLLADSTTLTNIRQSAFSTNEGYNVNYQNRIEKGKIEDSTVFMVTVDSDIYSEDNTKLAAIFADSKKAEHMNELLFNIFIESLTEEFRSILCSEDDIPTNIFGVNKNV